MRFTSIWHINPKNLEKYQIKEIFYFLKKIYRRIDKFLSAKVHLFTCMNRKGTSIVITFFLIISLSSLSFIPKFGLIVSATIYVDDVPGSGPNNPPEDYTSIQAAIDAAGSGGIVYIYSGYYDQTFVIGQPITLRGEDYRNTIIKSTSSFPTGWISWANPVYIEELTIIGAPTSWSIESSAIQIMRDSQVIIKKCHLRGNDGEGGGLGFGIAIDDMGNSVSIINSSIYGGNNGVTEQFYIRVFSSSALLLNSTHGNGTMVESGGSLTIKWYLHVRVIDNIGNPIENANVIVNDTFVTNVFNGYTDSNGYVRWIICKERVIPGSNYNPYEIFASKGIEIVAFTVNMYKSQEIWLLLDDLTFPLYSGWNMISIPIIHSNTKIDYVLSSISTEYDCAWCYDRATDAWYDSNLDFNYINHEMAFWIHMKRDAIFTAMDRRVPVSTDIDLYKGWNCVGYPSLINKNITEALSSIDGQYIAIQHYNRTDINDPWKHYHRDKPSIYNDLILMSKGQGFWIYVSQNCTWTIKGA